jgi:hypothetical protein
MRYNLHQNPDGSLRRTLEERFWSKVDKRGPDECWPWLANRTKQGYGRFNIDGHNPRASRVAWMLIHGTVPSDVFVCHSCDNPPCCNPRHLWVGTNLDNILDSVAKGRKKGKTGLKVRGEANGQAKLTSDIVIEARRRYARRDVSIRELADESDVCISTMARAINNTTWTHANGRARSIRRRQCLRSQGTGWLS